MYFIFKEETKNRRNQVLRTFGFIDQKQSIYQLLLSQN